MRSLSCLLFASLGVLSACAPDKVDDKGVVDESEPPGSPNGGGKLDDFAQVVPVQIESAHPYTNNLDRVHRVELDVLPFCAIDARLHFSVLRTEAGYDHVVVEPAGEPDQRFDGDRDDTWTEWFAINADHVDVRLDTDGSVTRHGFVIDQIEWDGQPASCGIPRFPPCAAGTVDTAPHPGVCECPVEPTCAPLTAVTINHGLARGRNRTAKRVEGGIASTSRPNQFDGIETTVVGAVDLARVQEVVARAAASGVLHDGGYERTLDPDGFSEELTITAGDYSVTFLATQGQHDPAIVALIDLFEGLFTCNPGGALACGDGFTCADDGACVEDQGCFCPANYEPQCGADGRTYSNACAAGCADMSVAHAGECGAPGDLCGGMQVLQCTDDNRCRYEASTFEAPYPDATGFCVARTYCDVPADCNGLPHPTVPGGWGCDASACAWHAGVQWQPVPGGRFETAHPYASSTSVWKEVYLPASAQALRLITTGSFRLEANYDYLEVWTWTAGAWTRVKRYTGTAVPPSDELPGRFHYLHFVSDASVTDTGFVVDAEWR